jgi:hypothetical protein
MLSSDMSETVEATFPPLGVGTEGDELVEKDIRDRFKKMCEGYFESVAKKLVLEHKVSATEISVRMIYPPSDTAEVARARSQKPRSLHPFRGDL